jgi:hypothetical protein
LSRKSIPDIGSPPRLCRLPELSRHQANRELARLRAFGDVTEIGGDETRYCACDLNSGAAAR